MQIVDDFYDYYDPRRIRAIALHSPLFHWPTPPFFGDSIESARLTQTMFIDLRRVPG